MKLNKLIFKFVSISFSVLVALLVVVGLVELGGYCYNFGYRVFTEAPVSKAPGKDVVVQVTSDMSEIDIGRMLEKEGLIDSGNLFFAQLKLSAYSGKLLPGIYTLNTSMTGKEMIAVMASEKEEESTETGQKEADTERVEGTEDGREESTETGTEDTKP